MKTVRFCQGCGLPLPADAPSGLCPQCLLKSDAPTLAEGGAVTVSAQGVRPIPGQTFGNYRIVRLLGQGGMGEVYEAEHVGSGRRIALKVMSHALASEQDRKRFLREGRLAASVNHPNVVYIHGSEEIAGAPVIAMELVHGGTLKDWLKREGPLPAAKAVEAALQIIAGLEAAQAAGVLHRDIKPANCFLDVDGTVKVGDFGLSISTLARGESLLTATGSVLGTPAYASPEQLRGEELDATSDIYSAGATLYHLLTGKTPFRATDFVKLITEVLDKQPEAPNAVRAEIPAELSRIVLRCLAKDRRARFQTYGELREALLPFCATETVPAKPSRRFLAGLLDDLAAYGPSLLYLVYWSLDPLDNLMRERTPRAALVWLPFFLWYLLYYTFAEGRWGAGFGKTICGLRVVGPDRQAPGLMRALLRTAIFVTPVTLPSFIVMALVPIANMRAALAQNEASLMDWLWLPLFLLLFLTMRRRNGYAAVHDLASGTRVIVRPKTEPRPMLVEVAPALASPELRSRRREEADNEVADTKVEDNAPSSPLRLLTSAATLQLGPYEIQASLWKSPEEELLQAFDPALRRKIWIHMRATEADTVSAARRDLNRPARLRWLNGGHTETCLWDAYEAVGGLPLLALGQEAQPWSAVRFWLLDLAEEISAALKDAATAARPALDRVWIAANGRALLLDFICPGLPQGRGLSTPLPLDGVEDMQRFLDFLAKGALQMPVPLHAQSFLTNLSRGAFEQVELIVGNLHSLVSRPARITRAWRAASLTLAPAIIVAFGLLLAGMINFERIRWQRHWADFYPGKPSLRAAAQVYQDAANSQNDAVGEKQLELTRIYLVNHFGQFLTNETFWANHDLTGDFSEAERNLLRQAVTARTAPAPETVQEAERAVLPQIRKYERVERAALGWVLIGTLVCGSALFSLIEFFGCSIFRQSPILRLFGIAVVDRQGLPATRPRLLWRWAVIWAPTGVLGFSAAGLATVALASREAILEIAPVSSRPLSILALVLMIATGTVWLALMIYAVLRPQRSLPDRLAATSLVPR